MKYLLLMLPITIVSLFIIGCASEQDTLKPTSTNVNVVEKNVVVACEVPKVECEFAGKGFIPTRKLLECVKIQKEVIRICTEKK